MSKCSICANHLKDKTLEPCASCYTLKIIGLKQRIAELEAENATLKADRQQDVRQEEAKRELN